MTQRTNEEMERRESDERAERVASIFREHGRYVWRSLLYLGIPEREVPDLVQDVFVIVHRKLDGFDGRSSMRTWLHGITARVAIANRRRARVRLEEVTDEPPARQVEAHQEADLERARQRARLREAIAALPDDLKLVFVQFEIEAVPMKDIAESLELPVKTVYSRLYKARDEVRRRFSRARLTGGGA